MSSLTSFSFRKQAKEVSVFAGASLIFRIFLCSVIHKDQEKLVIGHCEDGVEKTSLLNGK